MAFNMASHLAYAAGLAAVIMVISPLAALAAPPEMGASTYKSPSFSKRASSATDQLGSTVEHMTNTLPGRIAAAHPVPSPLGPNNTASVCAALTTTLTTTSHAAPSSATLLHAWPPSLANLSATSWRTSKTCTSKPARRSEAAMPEPMAPNPINPTLVGTVVVIQLAFTYMR